MKKFSGYDDVVVNDFEKVEKIQVGGHICKILEVTVENFATQNGQAFEILSIKFDIDEKDPKGQGKFYSERYKKDFEKDVEKAKWKGYHRVFIPQDDGSEEDERTKSNFKSFIVAVEKSNPGYDWEKSGWDEKTLVGKLFGGIFGIEEFYNPVGEVAWVAKCRFTRSIESITEEDTFIPKVKCVDKTYIDYEDWLEEQENKRKEKSRNYNNSNNDIFGAPVDNDNDNDDLPF